jgi:hypothetical protein
MDPLLLSLPAAFGLAAASGLNASLPLLLVSLAARMGLVHLAHPYDALGSDVAFYGLLVIAPCEFIVDKVPALDSVAQVVATPLVAASGAIVFASQTGAVDRVDPGFQVLLSLGAGATTATTVHLTRTAARPVLNLGLLGPVASLLEDVTAVALVAAALLAAALLPVTVALAALLVVGLRRRRRQARQEEALRQAACMHWNTAWQRWHWLAAAGGPWAGPGPMPESPRW